MRVYKVVEVLNNDRISAVAAGELQVTYPPREWVEAPVGGLLAFRTLEQAREWARAREGGEIWEADGESPVALPPRALAYPARVDQAVSIWDGYPVGVDWPSGTVAFERIRLLKRVD
jgi:hypothetical protein